MAEEDGETIVEAEVKEEVSEQEEKSEEPPPQAAAAAAEPPPPPLEGRATQLWLSSVATSVQLRHYIDYIQAQYENLRQRFNNSQSQRPSVLVDYDIMIGGAVAGELQALAPEALEPEEGQTAIANCAMCGETLQGTQVRILQCSHIFHDTCYQGWKNHRGQSATCPTCRNDLSPPQRVETVTPLQSQDEFQESQDNGSSSESEQLYRCIGCEGCGHMCDVDDLVWEGDRCGRCDYGVEELSIYDAFKPGGHNAINCGSCRIITDEVVDIIDGLGSFEDGTNYYCVVKDNRINDDYSYIDEIRIGNRNGEIVYPIQDGNRNLRIYSDTIDWRSALPDDIVQAIISNVSMIDLEIPDDEEDE